jgi:hypothetical protein
LNFIEENVSVCGSGGHMQFMGGGGLKQEHMSCERAQMTSSRWINYASCACCHTHCAGRGADCWLWSPRPRRR